MGLTQLNQICMGSKFLWTGLIHPFVSWVGKYILKPEIVKFIG